MHSSAARRGWSFGVFLASCSLLGCSAVLGYESDYDDSRRPADGNGGGAGASGGGAAGTSGVAGAAGTGQAGKAGATSGQGGAAGEAGGASSGGAAGAAGTQAGQAGASPGGSSGASGGSSGAGGANGGTAGGGGASGQAGSLSGGNAGAAQAGSGGAAGGGGTAGAGGMAGGSGGAAGAPGGSGGNGGALGGNGGAGGLLACVIPTAPSTTCGDLLSSRDNCGACGLSCGTQGECVGGRCVLDPITKAPYVRNVGYFGLPLAAQSTPGSDRLLYRTQVADGDAVHALYDISLSDDAPLLKRLGTNDMKVGNVNRPVTRWKSARFVPGTTQVIGVAEVARIPNEYPQDRVLVSLSRSTGEVLQTFQLSGDGGAWTDARPPIGGMVAAQETGDVVALGQKRGVVWDFVEGATGGVVLRGFPVPLTSNGVFDTVIEPRHAIATPIVAQNDVAYYLSQATMNAPFKLKSIKLEANATEASFGDASTSFVHPTSMAVVPNALFVADAGGNPASVVSPNGKLYRYDLASDCTKSEPQPVLVAEGLQRVVAIAADATHVYTLEVREVAGPTYENVLRRRFHDGTGQVALLVEQRASSFLQLATDDRPERAERLGKGFVLGQSFGKPLILFGLGSDPAEYREPTDLILGLPR